MLLSLKDYRIGTVVVNIVIFRLFTHFPALLSAPPFITLLSGTIALVIIFILFKFAEKLPDGSIIEYTPPWGKIVITIAASVYIAFNLIYAINQSSRLIKQISFPTSPLWYISLFLVAGALIGAFSKKAFSRLHNLFVPGIVTVVLIMIAATFIGDKIVFPSLFRTENISLSVMNILKGLLMYSDVFLILFLPIQKADRKKLTKTVVISSAIGLALNCAFIFAFAVNIPGYLVSSGEFPVFLLMKQVYIGRFFQRMDALIIMACAYSAMLYGCFNLIILTNTLGSRIRILKSRLFLIVCALAVFVVTFIP